MFRNKLIMILCYILDQKKKKKNYSPAIYASIDLNCPHFCPQYDRKWQENMRSHH